VVEVVPPEETDKTNSAVIEVLSDSVVTDEQAYSASRLNENGLGDVLDSRNEGGTTIVVLGSHNESVPSGGVTEESVPVNESSQHRDNPSDTAHNAPETSEVSPSISKLFLRL
jgi:hypothetical protein